MRGRNAEAKAATASPRATAQVVPDSTAAITTARDTTTQASEAANHPPAARADRRRHAEEDRRDQRVARDLGLPGDPEADADRDDGEDAADPGGDDDRRDRAQTPHVPAANIRRCTM